MKNLFFLLIPLFGISFISCGNQETAQEPSSAEEAPAAIKLPSPGDISYEEMLQISEAKNVKLLDVRTPEEHAEGAIPGAQLMEVTASDFKEKVVQLPKDQAVIVYCRSGQRSSNAMAIMNKLGFEEVYNLKGGYLMYEARQNQTE